MQKGDSSTLWYSRDLFISILSRRLKLLGNQQKAKATVPLCYRLEMGRDSVSLFLAQTQDILNG